MSHTKLAASIAHLAGDDARKAKLNYLRNALVSYAVYLEDVRTFSFLQIGFAVVPVFWPLLYIQRRSILKGARTQRAEIVEALDAWAIDLGSEAVALRRELDQLAAHEPRLLPWAKRSQAQLKA